MTQAAITTSGIPALAGPEARPVSRRGAERMKTTGQLVKVGHDQDEGLARCHNISDGGMAISAIIPLELNDRVTVTIALAELRGRVVWMNGRDCGIAFDETIDSAWILRNAGTGRAAYPSLASAAVREIKVTNDSNFRPGLKVRVILDGGAEKDGIIRWSQDNIAGVMLLDPDTLGEFGASYRLDGPG